MKGAFRKISQVSQSKFQCQLYHQLAVTLSNLLALSGFSHRSKWKCLLVDNQILSCSNNLCFPAATRFVCGRQLPATDSSLLYGLSILRNPRAYCHYQLGLKQKSCSSHAIYCLMHWDEKKAHETLRHPSPQNSHIVWRQFSSLVKSRGTLVTPIDSTAWEVQGGMPKLASQKPGGKAWKASHENHRRPILEVSGGPWLPPGSEASFLSGHSTPALFPSVLFSSLRAEAIHSNVRTLRRKNGQNLLELPQSRGPHYSRTATAVTLGLHMVQRLGVWVLHSAGMSQPRAVWLYTKYWTSSTRFPTSQMGVMIVSNL